MLINFYMHSLINSKFHNHQIIFSEVFLFNFNYKKNAKKTKIFTKVLKSKLILNALNFFE